ncbi:hypothetical protein SAMN02990966_02198 [Rhodospirillales bacterium URHD0017]|nr:hypothetical protein SAMN02990966_02198 [Rhodospirillales bacterium URHD0017]
MTPDAESYESYEYDVESSEFLDEAAYSDEAARRPGRPVFVRGGFASATLQTPRGPAKLNLPAAVATVTQLKTIENAVNANTRRMNLVQADLVRVRRELAVRRRDQQGQGMFPLLFMLLSQSQFRKDFEAHTHGVPGITAGSATATSNPPASSAGKSSFSSLLPLLFLQPGIFGGNQGNASATGSQDSFMGMSPILMLILFKDIFQ